MRIYGLQERRKQIMNKFLIMLKTEWKLSFRGMDMVIFALCMPVIVAVILGVIYGKKPAFLGAEYSFLEQCSCPTVKRDRISQYASLHTRQPLRPLLFL